MTDNTTENRRAETARETDDSDLIEGVEKTPGHQGRSGGNLASDVATQAEQERVRDPEAHEGVAKDDDIAHGERSPPGRGRG